MPLAAWNIPDPGCTGGRWFGPDCNPRSGRPCDAQAGFPNRCS